MFNMFVISNEQVLRYMLQEKWILFIIDMEKPQRWNLMQVNKAFYIIRVQWLLSLDTLRGEH